MARTCPNGHVNDDANRFCDQCGAPLPQNADAAPVAAAPAAGSATSGIACPVCGQENMPGTAFCDNCGAALPPPQPAVEAADASPAPAADPAPASAPDAGGATINCPQCGTSNDAANRFCDNCGASLVEQAGSAPADAQGAVGDSSGAAAAPAMTASTPLPTEGTTMPAPGAPDVADATPAGAGAPPDLVAPEALPAATPAPVASTPAPTSGDRQQLEERIATQRKLVEQLEQMQSSFGAATPAAIRQGLDEARSNLAQSEAELAALPPEKPPVDPAEVARLEEQIATQRKLVEQLEQMQSSFGAATPAAIRQGLDEARSNLAQSEAELEQLTGGQAAAPAHPLPSALDVATQRADELAQPAAPAQQPEPAQQPAPSPLDTQTSAAPEPPAQPVSPAPASITPAPMAPAALEQPAAAPPAAAPAQQVVGAHFVARDGKQISLPTGGDVVVGREDPISGIHPELDMTPFGGEAGGVSRRHAVLREQNGEWSVTDLDSTNYTRVDGNRLPPNTPTPLHNGARVQFGRIELEFRAS